MLMLKNPVMKLLKKHLLLLLFLLIIKPAAADITIALVVPKAGAYQQQGLELQKGVAKAIEEINAEGGILKQKVVLFPVDDRCNDNLAVSTAQMLALRKNEKINLVIGPYCANSFASVADTFAKAKIFQIIPTTVNYSHAKTIQKGLVKMLGYTNQQAVDFFNFYNTTFAGDRVAVITNSEKPDSQQEAEAILKEFTHHGKSLLMTEYDYKSTENDYDALAQKVAADGNKIAFLLGTDKNIRKMARALRQENEDLIIFTNKYAATEEYFEYLSQWANGTYFMELRGRDDDPDFAETLVRLRLSGFETEGLSLYGYSAVKLWEALVKKAKSLNYDKLSAKINDKTLQTEFGNKMFHNGAPTKNETYAIYKYENQQYNKVY